MLLETQILWAHVFCLPSLLRGKQAPPSPPCTQQIIPLPGHSGCTWSEQACGLHASLLTQVPGALLSSLCFSTSHPEVPRYQGGWCCAVGTWCTPAPDPLWRSMGVLRTWCTGPQQSLHSDHPSLRVKDNRVKMKFAWGLPSGSLSVTFLCIYGNHPCNKNSDFTV